jgi:parvulin-like peptidyl-prolyl isomerase
VGQEIWVTYNSPEHAKYGTRTGRTREEALALAKELRAKVEAGADVGALAEEHSNAPGGSAEGFTGLRDPSRPGADVRDHALSRTPIGELTPVEEWLGGFWFARRVDLRRGAELQAKFDHAVRQRVRFQAVAIVWTGAEGLREDDIVRRTKEQALERAEACYARAKSGEPFENLAPLYSDDKESRARGGHVHVIGPDGTSTEWVRKRQPGIEPEVMKFLFEGKVGDVALIETPRAYFVVKILERVQ